MNALQDQDLNYKHDKMNALQDQELSCRHTEWNWQAGQTAKWRKLAGTRDAG
jgi:hypothetical protein